MTGKTKSKNSLALKIAISLFLVFHITVMLVLSNGSSYLGRSMGVFLIPYGNFLSMNTTWNFFSPDPAHTLYIRYRVEFLDANGEEIKESVEGFVPPDKEKIAMDTSVRRFLYAMRFLFLDERRMETLLGPWLCRQHPQATRVSMEQFWRRLPSLDEAKIGKFNLQDEVTVKAMGYECNSTTRDEVGS